jgi:hypothetical protein
VYTIDADGVQYAVPAVAEVFELRGEVPFVTATPPAVYPEPETSPVAEYTVVAALTVAEDRYSAALNESPVPVVKLCVPVSSSPINEVHIACVFAMSGSFIQKLR